MKIGKQGSLVVFAPECDYEYEWLMVSDNCASQWEGNKLIVDRLDADCILEDAYRLFEVSKVSNDCIL